MSRTVRPRREIEGRIDELGGIVGDEPKGALSELATLGAKLIIQRAVEEEFDAWLRPSSASERAGALAAW